MVVKVKDVRPSVVVRPPPAPARRATFMVALSLVGLVGLYIVYELGRYNAGYDQIAAAQERSELEVEIERLEKYNRELRTKMAELDTFRVGRAREQAEISRLIGDLQAQVARQSQELAFYRGVVAQGAAAIDIKIGEVRVSPAEKPHHFVVHLSLVRSGKADNLEIGSIALSVDGEHGSRSATMDLASLTSGRQRELPFNFRYYQNVDQEITVPADFKPEHLSVEVRTTRKDVSPLAQTFLWGVDTSH
jgi:hypothetical protein